MAAATANSTRERAMWTDAFREFGARLAKTFRGSRFETEMDDELRFHVEMQIEQLVRSGVSPDEARRRALIAIGGLEQTRENCRDAIGVRLLNDFVNDLRYAVRTLVRSPGFTIVAVLTLALGIGANTAVFSVVNALLLQPLPFEEPERIVMLWEQSTETGVEHEQVAWGDFFDWREKNTTFEDMGFVVSHMAHSRNFMLRTGEDVARIRARHASSGLFDVLGVQPLLGQTLSAEDDKPGGTRRAVLSYAVWTRAFHGDPQIVGRPLDVGRGAPFEVIGVMPPTFRFPEDAEVWLSVSGFQSEAWLRGTMPGRSQHGLWVFGRLKEGIPVAQATNDLAAIQRQIFEAPENKAMPRLASAVTVTPLLDQVNGADTKPALLVLLGAVAFVLLIACANVANLQLVRAVSRRREMAIRAALGAGRWRLLRQLLTENVLLALLGAAVAVLFAVWGVELLDLVRTDATWLGVKEFRFDRLDDVRLDARVLAFTMVVSVLTGVLFGLIPAAQASRLNVNEVLKEDSRSGTPGKATRLFRNSLLVIEVALALVLLSGAGMALRSFAKMLAVDPGVQAEQVLRAELDLDMAHEVYGLNAYEAHDEALRRVAAVPGVESVSSCGELPILKSGWNDTIQIVGPEHDGIDAANLPGTDFRLMSPGLFRTLGIPILGGRDFTEDDRRESPRVAIVNQSFADRFFHGANPVGRKVRMRGQAEWETEIVGVVGNVRNYSEDSAGRDELYLPFQQQFMGGSELGPEVLIRISGPTEDLVPVIQHAVDGTAPGQQVLVRFRNLQTILDSSASSERFQTVLLGVFSGAALLLAMIGVYGVMAYSTSQRIREFGIRIALGAQPMQILSVVVGHGVLLCGIGVGIGVGVSLLLAQLLRSLVFGFDAINPATLGGAAGLLMLVGVLACLIPGWSAMRIDPLRALRHE